MSRLRIVSWPMRSVGPKAAPSTRSIDTAGGSPPSSRRRRAPHPSHAHLDLTLGWIERSRARRAVITNMHIDLDYDAVMRQTPPHVIPAHDGLVLDLS